MKVQRQVIAGGTILAMFSLAIAYNAIHPLAASGAELSIVASYLFFMFVGYWIRNEVDQTGAVRALPIILFVGLVLLCVVVARAYVGRFNPLLSPASVFISSMLGLVVFMAALSSRAPVSGTVCKLGDWSYGIYLFHPLALFLVLAWYARPTNVMESCVFTAAVILIVVAAAALGHHLIEKPGIRLGAALKYALFVSARTGHQDPD